MSPRLCQLYLRDVLSFFKRSEIEGWRSLSRHFNASVADCPVKLLPRHRFISLEIDAVYHYFEDPESELRRLSCCGDLEVSAVPRLPLRLI